MSVQHNYCRTIARELRRHAVWQPGQAYRVGDYGVLDGAEFRPLGHISEFIDESLITTQASRLPSLEFTSAGTTVVLVTGDAAVAEEAGAKAHLKIGFESGDAVYLRAARLSTTHINNLRVMTEDLRAKAGWQFEWAIVSGVTSADRLSVILAERANSEVSVVGDVSALKAFEIGQAKAGGEVSVEGEAGLKLVGADGPVLVDLVRLRRILGGTRRAALPGAIPLLPYEEIAPAV